MFCIYNFNISHLLKISSFNLFDGGILRDAKFLEVLSVQTSRPSAETPRVETMPPLPSTLQ